MNQPIHVPTGTTSEVRRSRYIARSLSVLMPLLMLGAVVAWVANPPVSPDLDVPQAAPLVSVPETVTEMVTEAEVGDPPTISDASVSTAGEPVTIQINASHGVRLVTPPTSGLVQLQASGIAVYAPDSGFVGSDSFVVESCNSDECSDGKVIVDVLPTSTSKYVATAVNRVLDTRSGEPLVPGESVNIQLAKQVDYEAVALSVTLLQSQVAGGVQVDGGAGPVSAITVGGSGAMTTNLVIVPVTGPDSIAVTNQAGGHVVIDVVGIFESSTESAEGRFVRVDPVEIASLVTAVDGREANIQLTDVTDLPAGEVSAVLALVTADVGDEGGMVRLGPGVDSYDQMLMWGPPGGPNLQRRGVVLLTPDDVGALSFRYEGGSEIELDVLGYFTSSSSANSSTGLYVPDVAGQTISERFEPGTSVVGVVPAYAGAAFVNVSAEAGATSSEDPRDLGIASGRTIGTPLAVGPSPGGVNQGIEVETTNELQATLQLLGIFLR